MIVVVVVLLLLIINNIINTIIITKRGSAQPLAYEEDDVRLPRDDAAACGSADRQW